MKDNLRAYFLIKKDYPIGYALNSMAHAGTMLAQYYPNIDDPIMNEWYNSSFRKVTCKVTDGQFEKAKQFHENFVVTELAFDKKEVILVFKPRRDWDKFFKRLRLWS